MSISALKFRHLILLTVFLLSIVAPITAKSEIIDFHFTGNMMVVLFNGQVFENAGELGNPIPLTPISATLSYNTDLGIGGSNMSISMSGTFTGIPVTFHDITMEHVLGTNIINGSMLVDLNDSPDISTHITWDASGFLNAINEGLQVGDTISGTILKKDTTGDGEFDQFIDVFSANPHSDTILLNNYGYGLEGPAPLAATSESRGLGYDINGNFVGSPLLGLTGLINMGSGDSMTVTSISSVPVPATFWLFGSGLIGLIGLAGCKK